MRHERITRANIAAAAWPSTIDGIVLAEPEALELSAVAEPVQDGPTPAAPDVAAGVGGLIVAAYVGLILVFFAFFAGSPAATMAIAISAGFVAIYFTVPRIFFAVEPDKSRRPSLSDFMYRGMDTLTGHSSGRDALVQMLIVPVLLSLGLLAMGIAGAIYL
jgi:hypothetical protein